MPESPVGPAAANLPNPGPPSAEPKPESGRLRGPQRRALVATLLPFAAPGDRCWGPRPDFLGGLASFTGAALASTLAFACALQGVGVSALMSVNVALIRLIYLASRLGRGLGLNALVVGVIFAAGPIVASLVLSVGHWRWLFALNLPLGLLALAFALPGLPRDTTPGSASIR